MIQIKDIHLQFADQVIFNSINCTIQQSQKVGLVGRNGAGKSTLLKVIANHIQADSGTVQIQKSSSIAYMPQEVVITSTKTILDETLSSYAALASLYEEKQALESVVHKQPTQEEINRYAELEHELAENSFDTKKTEAQKILAGLGFTNMNQSVQELSVGWRMRIVLAKLLLQDADFYLFDEPTNHLDISAKDWFLNFLQQGNFGYLLVCHDRYFLDKACNLTLEVSQGNLTMYHGNYSYYTKQKSIVLEQQEQAYLKQQQEIKQKQRTIDRFRSKSSKAKMVQSMIKSLDKVEKIELESSEANIHLHFAIHKPSGRIVLKVNNVAHRFDHLLFDHASFEIEQHDKVALVAPNGTGKTTLFNLIAKKLPLQQGSIELGYNVNTALFDQDQEKVLDPNKTILEEVSSHTSATDQQIRTMLGSLLFNQDDVEKKCSVLSGGERNRVAMAKVALSKANFLLLDEPTNHLDLETKEIILTALQKFAGTILFVSHDQDFVNKLANKIIELTPTRTITYLGNYDDYLATRKPSNTIIQKQKPNSQKDQKELFDLQKKCKNLENKISTLEKKLQHCVHKLGTTEYGTKDYQLLETEYKNLEKTITLETEKWEQLLEKMEN